MGQKGAQMTTMRTHFTFRVDTWTPDVGSMREALFDRVSSKIGFIAAPVSEA